METDSYDREQLVNDGVVMDGVIYNPDVEANAEIYRTFNFLESGTVVYQLFKQRAPVFQRGDKGGVPVMELSGFPLSGSCRTGRCWPWVLTTTASGMFHRTWPCKMLPV